MSNEIYTIGYSSFTLRTFISVLKKYSITAVVDVRSQPYSQHKPEFNRETLKGELAKNKIAYVFLGEECGARITNPKCYINGKVSYALASQTSTFNAGLERIQKGMENFKIVLMCAEKDPITCHRTILVCRNLKAKDLVINHILSNGALEKHCDAEQRLLRLFNLHHPEMFRNYEQRLSDAYSRQGEKIAYEATEPSKEKLG